MIRDRTALVAASKKQSLEFQTILEPWNISRSAKSKLRRWLREEALDWKIERASAASFDGLKHREQVTICTKLEAYAAFIADQFHDLHQVSSLDRELFSSYKSVTSSAREVNYADEMADPREWSLFRRRLRSDAKLLVDVAKETRAELKKKVKQGQPTKKVRDDLFIELRDKVSALIPADQNTADQKQRLEVTKSLWNLYFPDDKIMEITSALQFIQRRRKESKQ